MEKKSHAPEKGWLNLSLGQYQGSSCSRSSMKVYTCNFCKRKFYSPQALGGHQNAHRRERNAARKHCTFQFNKAVEMHSRLLVGTRGMLTKYAVACVQPYAGENSVDMKWSGSCYSSSQPASQETDSNTLDLNLKL